tara:strand:- start:4562 stop:4915 length:354 start_codon:yes stop_codon:yes gene_type:complete
MNKNRHIKKEGLIKALEQSLGVVTVACKQMDIPRSTYYKWYNEDKEFKKQVDELKNVSLDFAESQLHNQIGDGNVAATIFYLKTKGKERGYVEKSELDITSGEEPVKINIIIDGVEH